MCDCRACLGGKSSVGVAKVAPFLFRHARIDRFPQLTEATLRCQVVNMEPRWNETLGSYSLNFYSRVKKASKKNFLVRCAASLLMPRSCGWD